MRSYVEKNCDEWFILSGKHGLVHPAMVIEPYDFNLDEATNEYRELWACSVHRQLRNLEECRFTALVSGAYANAFKSIPFYRPSILRLLQD